MRDPETYQKFDEVILTHTCREVSELAYGEELAAGLPDDPLCDEYVHKFRLYNTVTREDFPRQGRITDLISSGKLFTDLGVPPLNPETDRVMICGSMQMIQDTKALCEEAGLVEGSNATPADFVIEKAFAG